jgi:hypothetical protein
MAGEENAGRWEALGKMAECGTREREGEERQSQEGIWSAVTRCTRDSQGACSERERSE